MSQSRGPFPQQRHVVFNCRRDPLLQPGISKQTRCAYLHHHSQECLYKEKADAAKHGHLAAVQFARGQHLINKKHQKRSASLHKAESTRLWTDTKVHGYNSIVHCQHSNQHLHPLNYMRGTERQHCPMPLAPMGTRPLTLRQVRGGPLKNRTFILFLRCKFGNSFHNHLLLTLRKQ